MTDISATPEVQLDSSNSEKTPLVKWGWARVVLFFGSGFLIMIAIRATKRFFVYSNGNLSGSEAMFWGQLIKFLGFALIIYLLRVFVDRKSFSSLGIDLSSKFRKDLMLGVATGFAMIATIFATLYFSGLLIVTSIQFPAYEILLGFGIFVIVAFREELMNRGYILANLMDSMNNYLALVLSVGFFALLHADSPTITTMSLINVFLGGLTFGVYYIYQKNLWFPIGLHFAWNFAQGTIFGSPVSGNQVTSVATIEVTGREFLTGGGFGFEGSILTTILLALAILIIHLKRRNASPLAVTIR